MDMPEKIWVTIADEHPHPDTDLPPPLFAEYNEYGGHTKFIRADAGTVLPELPEKLAKKYEWHCIEFYGVNWVASLHDNETGKIIQSELFPTPRAAAEDAIAKIGENNG